VTGFDIFALIVILISAGAGWVRGALREVITLFSFVLAAFVAMLALPVTAPVGRGLIDPDWLGSIVAVIVSFVLIYFLIRLAGSALSKGAKDHPQLGGIDRFLGVFIGAVRALVLLGAIHLVVVAAMPGERTPRWLTDAAVRPLSAGSARVIQIILPGIGRGADALTPLVSSSVSRGFSDEEALPPTQSPPNSPATAP
jgi:membrane protein required for colicin V production